MDPIAHTLFGATLAETGLKRRSRYATAALIIGANLPDIDAFATFLGTDTALFLRRGWTHGVLAMAVLPLMLTGILYALNKLRPRQHSNGPPFQVVTILILSYLATWSHPLLDWTNTYGVRLLMPFDDRWFYGDTLFIVDPWFWLMTAATVVVARSQSAKAIAAWLVLGILTTLLILTVPLTSPVVKAIWLSGVAAMLVWRLSKPADQTITATAKVLMSCLIAYIAGVYLLARQAENAHIVQDSQLTQVQSNPIPGNPFMHRIIQVFDTHYHVIPPNAPAFDVERQPVDAIISTALADDSIRGFSNWMRFPYWEIEETETGWTVTFRDLRYVDPGQQSRGIGMVSVQVARNVVAE